MSTASPAAPSAAKPVDDMNALAGIVQVSPSEAAVASRDTFIVALKDSCPLIDLMLGGINFPKRTGRVGKDGEMSIRSGQIVHLSKADVARVREAASRTFLRHNYMPGVFDTDGTPKIMGTIKVEASPKGVSNPVMIHPTDIPISEFVIMRKVEKIVTSDQDEISLEIEHRTNTIIAEQNAADEAKQNEPSFRRANKARAQAAAAMATSPPATGVQHFVRPD